jgi:hypothetical protein
MMHFHMGNRVGQAFRSPAQLVAGRAGGASGPILRGHAPGRMRAPAQRLPRTFADLGAMDWASTIAQVANDAAAVYSGKPPPPPPVTAGANAGGPAFPATASSMFTNPLVVVGGLGLLGILAYKLIVR